MSDGFANASEAPATGDPRINISIVYQNEDDSWVWNNATANNSWNAVEELKFSFYDVCDQECLDHYRQQASQGYFNHNLTQEDCLETYGTSSGGRQDVVVVSSSDLFNPTQPLSSHNNTFLFSVNITGVSGDARY